MVKWFGIEHDRIRHPAFVLTGGLGLGFLGLLVIWALSGMNADSAATAATSDDESVAFATDSDQAEPADADEGEAENNDDDVSSSETPEFTVEVDVEEEEVEDQVQEAEDFEEEDPEVGEVVEESPETTEAPDSTLAVEETVQQMMQRTLNFDANVAHEQIAGLDTDGVTDVWQIDYSCRTQFSNPDEPLLAENPAVRARIDLGFGSAWTALKLAPNELDASTNRLATRAGYRSQRLENSRGQTTDATISIDGRVGCFTLPTVGGSTGAQSVTSDYFWLDHLERDNVGPATFEFDGFRPGDYKLVVISASKGGHGRESIVSGRGFELSVPFSPDSTTLRGNYAVSPQFEAGDSFSFDIQRGPDANGLGEREASIAGMVLVRYAD